MKTRTERYYKRKDCLVRTEKNDDLYNKIYEETTPISRIDLLDNVSEIDVDKLKEMIGPIKKESKEISKSFDLTASLEKEYDIYEDIENKMYDINSILEKAKEQRGLDEKEKYKKLRNTQFNILSRLELNQEEEQVEGEMVTDFFTKEKDLSNLMEMTRESKNLSKTKSSTDLFSDLKGSDNTEITDPIEEANINIEEIKKASKEIKPEENTFYTSVLPFTKEDFDGFQDLQGAIKTNNTLIKVLIGTLIIVLLITLALFYFGVISLP
ncbi:MAG: hypothetical protein ACOXZR_03505 [Bacilli bacterium]|jgi:hypothetical protein